MIINHNITALNTYRQLNINSNNQAKSMAKLSSGLRINSAADDAAGLSISEKMKGQIRGLDQASRNAQDGISMISTAEGALNETQSILQRMRELATQASNDTNTDQDRGAIQNEMNQLSSEVNRIGNTTEFNTQKLLNGGDAHTSNIRYSVVTKGQVASGVAKGGVSNVNVVKNSVAAGTGAISPLSTITSSTQAASAGTIGSPFTTVTNSSTAGTAATSAVTELEKGALGAVTSSQTTAASDPGTPGVDTYKITSNFGEGNTFSVDGQTFTAVAAGSGNSASQFEVGATIKDTMDNLTAALNANGTVSGTYTVSNDSTDTITLTETNANDGAANNAGAAAVAVGTNAAEYGMEVTSNFTDGDTITIGSTTYTAGTDFNVGTSIADTVDNIKNAITGSGDAVDNNYTVSVGDPAWGADNNTLVFTAKTAGADASAVAMNASIATASSGITGVYKFELGTNFEVGQKIKIGDAEFTAVDATTGSNSATSFKVGSDIDTTAANLKAAMDAAQGAGKLSNYNLSIGTGINADTITLTEATASGTDLAAPSVTNVTEADGKYSFDITSNFSAGDKVTIDGVDLVAGTDFEVGSDLSTTADNLKDAINDNSTLNAKYGALTDNTAFVTGNRIVLTENSADGADDTTVSLTKGSAQQGEYQFLVNNNFTDGDKITLGGTSLVAGKDFTVGADVNETATNIKDAIAANANLSGKYTASSTNNEITLQENTASGTDLSNPTVSRTGTAGEFKFSMEGLEAGTTVSVDGTNLTLTSGGNEAQTAVNLKSLIDNNATLSTKYNVTVDEANVTLTQKAGQESASSPQLSFTTKAGSGFRGSLQIGANTGQSMAIGISDMRSQALGITSMNNTDDKTVNVNGKEYVVKWTADKSVTDGTDNINSEFALNVSDAESATAAISVLDDAINSVSSERSKLGAYQNRLDHTINNLTTSSQNITDASSRITDVDMAKEMMEQTKSSVLAQAAQAMLAQANQQPQQILQLLR